MAPIILVVDGDPSNCAEWESLLQSQGCDVIAARTGETALALCPKLQPDLVLLSDLLPDVHGLEVCRRLKADPRNRLTPVIMIASSETTISSLQALVKRVPTISGGIRPRPGRHSAASNQCFN